MNQSIDIKTTFEEEIRRFVLQPVSYSHLLSTLRTLFSLPEDVTIITKFNDDENDLVTFNSDDELAYACTLLKAGPLKITLSILVESHQDGTRINSTPELEGCRKSGRGRGGQAGRNGRGRGRGGCGKKWSTETEPLEANIARISQKIQKIESQLKSSEIPDDRREFLAFKLQKFQAKLQLLQSGEYKKKEHSNDTASLEAKKIRFSKKIQKIQEQLKSTEMTDDRREFLNSKLQKFQEKLEFIESGKVIQRKEFKKKCGNDSEFIETKRLLFSQKIQKIQERLTSSEMTDERREFLNSKLQKFQEKLEFLESGKCCNKGEGKKKLQKKDNPNWESLKIMKQEKNEIRENLQNARESEDKEKIQELRLALKDKKQQIRLLKSSTVSPTPK